MISYIKVYRVKYGLKITFLLNGLPKCLASFYFRRCSCYKTVQVQVAMLIIVTFKLLFI